MDSRTMDAPRRRNLFSNVAFTISFPNGNRPSSRFFFDAGSLYSDSLAHIAHLIKSFLQRKEFHINFFKDSFTHLSSFLKLPID